MGTRGRWPCQGLSLPCPQVKSWYPTLAPGCLMSRYTWRRRSRSLGEWTPALWVTHWPDSLHARPRSSRWGPGPQDYSLSLSTPPPDTAPHPPTSYCTERACCPGMRVSSGHFDITTGFHTELCPSLQGCVYHSDSITVCLLISLAGTVFRCHLGDLDSPDPNSWVPWWAKTLGTGANTQTFRS